MKLLTASEDLRMRTLENVPGALGKLLYLASLRDTTGEYRHWGLAWAHGEKESQAAARNAHEDALKEVLRTPLRELWDEMHESAGIRNGSPHPGQSVVGPQFRMLPAGTSQAAESHLNSVLRALAELDRAWKETPSSPAA